MPWVIWEKGSSDLWDPPEGGSANDCGVWVSVSGATGRGRPLSWACSHVPWQGHVGPRDPGATWC
ncbi:hypothetical protein BHE74_00050540 [Ensete ventricosum]|nr:hypothetical protein BHE74_00050540 [Ensete ventricosum]